MKTILVIYSIFQLFFTGVEKNKVDIETYSYNNRVFIITSGFRSCHDCYTILYDYFYSQGIRNNVVILNEYKSNIIQRKQQYNWFKKLLNKSEFPILFEEENNPFTESLGINIHPSVIIIENDTMKTFKYHEIFTETTIKNSFINYIKNL